MECFDSQDDLIADENEIVQEALKRLPPKVSYDRVYRLRRAVQCSLAHTILPKEEQTKPEAVCYIWECHVMEANVALGYLLPDALHRGG